MTPNTERPTVPDAGKLFLRQCGPSFTHKVTGEFIEKPKALMHLCVYEGCTEWGSFSIGAAWIKDIPGQWACRTHRDWLYALSTSRRQDTSSVEPEVSDANQPDGSGDLLTGDHLEP